MAGRLDHAPSEIIANLLVTKGYGTEPSLGQPWPVDVGDEPNEPDDSITVFDVGSEDNGRDMVTGQRLEHYTFQVRVRSDLYSQGWIKVNQIARGMDESVYLETVTIGTTVYRVHSISRRGGILSLGKDYPAGERNLFSLNAKVSIRQLNPL